MWLVGLDNNNNEIWFQLNKYMKPEYYIWRTCFENSRSVTGAYHKIEDLPPMYKFVDSSMNEDKWRALITAGNYSILNAPMVDSSEADQWLRENRGR